MKTATSDSRTLNAFKFKMSRPETEAVPHGEPFVGDRTFLISASELNVRMFENPRNSRSIHSLVPFRRHRLFVPRRIVVVVCTSK